jgi:transcription-repair coupling factor (superfamily II helicase)
LGNHPHFVVLADDDRLDEFVQALGFFAPEFVPKILPRFDVNPLSGLTPAPRISAQRVGWLTAAHSAQPGQIFVATAEALSQLTMPVEFLSSRVRTLRVGTDLGTRFAQELTDLGYQPAPVVEDVGSFSLRGGLIDVFPPGCGRPLRIELFGDSIESIREFDPESQRSTAQRREELVLPPAREVLFCDETQAQLRPWFFRQLEGRTVEVSEREAVLHSIQQAQHFPEADFLISGFFAQPSLPLEHVGHPDSLLWIVNPVDCLRSVDARLEQLRSEAKANDSHVLRVGAEEFLRPIDQWPLQTTLASVEVSGLAVDDFNSSGQQERQKLELSTTRLKMRAPDAGTELADSTALRIRSWRSEGLLVLVSTSTVGQAQRLRILFEKHDLRGQIAADGAADFESWLAEQRSASDLVHIIPRALPESLRFNEERLAVLRDEDFFGRKQRRRETSSAAQSSQQVTSLALSDFQIGDRLVHVLHGIGRYDGLQVMSISGAPAEFIQLSYKDGDKLYLPIYRIGQLHKYAGAASEVPLDKLGSQQWSKTTGKVRNQLRELAADLLKLYAERSQSHRPAFPRSTDEIQRFADSFLYDETADQLKAIEAIERDMLGPQPMDRLVCGDVGFGKTEVAMRAAFHAALGQRQVAVLAPTTVLSFQHHETFVKRFKGWPIEIRALNRFVPPSEIKKTLSEVKEGKVDILIGTHRLLSKDVAFKNLGLLVIDEEQRFGVVHKEKIRKLRVNVDTLTMSATPIPRTLNMSLVGMRDLSLINTPPHDRLPTRTFVCKFDSETIRRAILSEMQRGGQVFFLHNRVQSIYALVDEIRQLVPEARIRVGHGQMPEHELEQTMMAFFRHEIDVLVCTTIVESGIDNPRANTMFIDNAHQLGLSQLYQLRGRVGRSKERAYCYLLIPPNRRLEQDAQERLKVIQENTALGSGIRIAQHDLELRGAGNILGEDQSGHIDAVGYEMYLELLEEALQEARGEPVTAAIEPDINIAVPALIPESYMPDLRMRLSYYKAMTQIESANDMDQIEEQMRDQFGQPPEPVLNLLGLMLIRRVCQELGIRDLSAGQKSVSLAFTESTPLPPQTVVQLAQKQGKRYGLTPDMRLIVRMEQISWPLIYDELLKLRQLCN